MFFNFRVVTGGVKGLELPAMMDQDALSRVSRGVVEVGSIWIHVPSLALAETSGNQSGNGTPFAKRRNVGKSSTHGDLSIECPIETSPKLHMRIKSTGLDFYMFVLMCLPTDGEDPRIQGSFVTR